MPDEAVLSQLTELERQIAELPAGSLSVKNIKGRKYYYHRWYENKKRREKYLSDEEAAVFSEKISRRKALEAELNALRGKIAPERRGAQRAYEFASVVRTGGALRIFSNSVRGYKKRECFQRLHEFIYGDSHEKVMILYGLRRTGKTTMIRQILAEMSESDIRRAAFIQVTSKNTLKDMNADLKHLEAHGFRYVFIDEVTLMDDFIEGAALFSDVFAACGMQISRFSSNKISKSAFTSDKKAFFIRQPHLRGAASTT